MTDKTGPGGPSTIQPICKKDLLFKTLAKVRSVYLTIVYTHLPPAWIKLLDMDKAELADTVSVTARLREKLGDVVLKIPFLSNTGDLFLGVEQVRHEVA